MIEQVWDIYDDDGNGDLDEAECFQFLGEIIEGKYTGETTVSIGQEEHKSFFNVMDNDGDAAISKEEMIDMFLDLLAGEKKISNRD